MNGYIITILVVSFVSGIFNSIMPNESGLKKYLRYTVSIVCILSLITPILSFSNNFKNIKDNVINFVDDVLIKDKIELSNSIIINTSNEKISDSIKKIIVDKYNLSDDEVLVEIEFATNENVISIKEIYVFLTGKASWSDCEKVENFLKNNIGSEITVKRR